MTRQPKRDLRANDCGALTTLRRTACETGSGLTWRGAGAGGYPAPAFATYYFFFAVFFFAAFFLAFFFAAIIVSFKVNLGMLIAR